METRHKKFEILNDIFDVPANQIRFYTHKLKHVGKSNHTIYGTFSVIQGKENVVSKINFYLFSTEQLVDWFFNNLSLNCYSFFPQRNNFAYYSESASNTFNLPVKGDTNVCFVLDNRYLLTVNKEVNLNIFEEWDEEISHADIVTTVPPQDESLKNQIEKMSSESKESLKIISPYADLSLVNKLIEKQNQGINIQIILRKDNEVKGLAKDGLNQIRKNFPQKYRLHEDIHSRLIIRDDNEVLISSADLTQKSLQGQLNLGIVISDQGIVVKALDFFNKVWQESK